MFTILSRLNNIIEIYKLQTFGKILIVHMSTRIFFINETLSWQ